MTGNKPYASKMSLAAIRCLDKQAYINWFFAKKLRYLIVDEPNLCLDLNLDPVVNLDYLDRN